MSENPVFKQWEDEEKRNFESENTKINNRRHLQMLETAQISNNMHPLRDLKLLGHILRNETFLKKKSSIKIHWKPKFPKNFDSLTKLKSGDCSKYIKSYFKGSHNRYFSNGTTLDIDLINSQIPQILKKRTNFSTVIWENLDDFDMEEHCGNIKIDRPQNHIDFKKIKIKLYESSKRNSFDLSLAEKKKIKQEKWKQIAKNIKDYRRNHSLLGESLNAQPNMYPSADLPCISKFNPNKTFFKAKTLQTHYLRSLD